MSIYRGDMNLLRKNRSSSIHFIFLRLYHRLKEQEGHYVTSIIQLMWVTL